MESRADDEPTSQMVNVTYNIATGQVTGTTFVTLFCQNLITAPTTARFDSGSANVVYTTNGDGRVTITCNTNPGASASVMTSFDFSAAFKTTLNGLGPGFTTTADTLSFNAGASGFADPGFGNPAIQFNITIIDVPAVAPAPSPNIPTEVSNNDANVVAGAFLHLFGLGEGIFFDPDDPFKENSNRLKPIMAPFKFQTQEEFMLGDEKLSEFRESELDARGRSLIDKPYFALTCTGASVDQSFPFAFNSLLKVNGLSGFLNLDCSKPINLYEYELTREGLDIVESLNDFSFTTSIDYIGNDPEGIRTNFEPLVLNIDFSTKAAKILDKKINPDDLVTRTERFTLFEKVQPDLASRTLESTVELLEDEERFVPADPPLGKIIIQGSASFSAGLFEEGEDIEERFKEDLSTVTIKPNYKQLRKFIGLNDRTRLFNFAEADIEVLNSSRFKIRPNDLNDTVLIDFTATLPVSVSKFKVKGLLRNKGRALRDFRRNGSISQRFIRRPQQRKIALRVLRRGGTIFAKTKRIVVPVEFSAEGVN